MATTSATLVLLPTTTAVVPSRGGEHSADGNPHPLLHHPRGRKGEETTTTPPHQDGTSVPGWRST
ncbi:hypothetical protein [Saccharopolyspora rectivirgula]|mgnify:CR=1 FL=1|uniref:hypothetical protein n=1 Tax=Saccharopolyspora rectivirgula TaxID=28042 RepID=UPI002409CF86|nr:hypothetical protein [Saccharopolyspora rectivirgula]